MFLPMWRLFSLIFSYYVLMEALKKLGLVKSK